MIKTKYLLIILLVSVALIFIPNKAYAAVESERKFEETGGSFNLYLTGLNLDTTHEYQFGIVSEKTNEIENWFDIEEYTENTATVFIDISKYYIKQVALFTNTGYLTIKDITKDTNVLENYEVDLTPDYMKLVNTSLVKNGQSLSTYEWDCGAYTSSISKAYYQYQKITDQNVIDRYLEIKENNGNVYEMKDMFNNTYPTSNWNEWNTWIYSQGGSPSLKIEAPDEGLYYMWLYFKGDNIKDIYAFVIVDALSDKIYLQSINLPLNRYNVSVGKSITLTPFFVPSNATNKNVTWSSSDEKIAKVDSNGKVTALKPGTVTIKITAEEGNGDIFETCTVTVVEDDNENNDNENNNNNNGNNNDDISNIEKDETVSPTPIPQTGEKLIIFIIPIVILSGIIIAYIKLKKSKDIK